ncbi:MAG: DUF1015 domain-containing protein [Candidatus Omnitrophica bacterium]|nr:DUF1015 domain-containing protein [Candidatus Omnitrophota bacterium]
MGSLAKVVTPPYDVISPKGQQGYYRKHPYNFIRVVFGKEYRSDSARNNRYTRAKETLERWISEGILVQDKTPALYPHLQEYVIDGKRCRRWGLISLVRLDSRISPHEETRTKPKQDRIKLLQTVHASLSPIFGLIPDTGDRYRNAIQQACRNRRPIASIRLDGVLHRLWRIDEPTWIRRFTRLLEKKELVIADGHHRLEAALYVRNARRRTDPRFSLRSPYNYTMFFLAAAGEEEPGLLPTHRVVHGGRRDRLHRMAAEAAGTMTVESVEDIPRLVHRLRQLRCVNQIGIGLYTGNGGGYLLRPASQGFHQLDVEWLHEEIVPEWIGPRADISFTQDIREGLRLLKTGRAKALFLTQPPSLQEVFNRARASRRMPGKTTYFYPKPLAGLVEYKFEE